jgi:hypothetical protein
LKTGCVGKFKDNAASSDEYWSSKGSKEDELFKTIKNLYNYDPSALWNGYGQDLFVRSRFDIDSLLQRISSLVGPNSIPHLNLWYPSML